MKTTHDLIIIGGGAGGLTVASGAAQLGMKVLLVEREHMGGDCLYNGCVPSKTLLKSSLIYSQALHSPSYGLPQIDPPRVDLSRVMERVGHVIEGISHHDSVERFESLGAEVVLASANFLSPHEIEVGGNVYTSKKIVVATGSSPAVPPIPGLEGSGYITNKDIFTLNELPEHMITLGGGPIGVELSQALGRLGARVSILNKESHLLPREDEDVASVVEAQLTAEGVSVFNDVHINRISRIGDTVSIEYGSGGEKKSISGDKLLIAAGRKGNTSGMNLEEIGIELNHSFIKVDSRLQTSIKHIHAIGDVNGQFLFTHVAGAEGSFMVRKLVLGLPGRFSYKNVPWCTFSDPELASIGYNEGRAMAAGIKYQTVITPLSDIDRAQAENRPEGRIKILIDKKERIIGTQIVGVHAGDLILPSLYAVTKKYKLMDLMSPMIPYPTLGEIQKRAAGSYYGPKLFNPRTRGILKKFYGYRG
ncbi:MAG: FAD-dependent oxidoreductase [Spirochaetales bacterium]|nr:FAD-dependent oxidoreductase [Spirochaetales bacterium]